MVELADIQAAYYMVAASGVLVTAIFYVVNLRETSKNRRIAFSMGIQQTVQTEEWQLRFMEAMNMQWSDFDDFKKKYDSSVDTKSFAKRHSILITYDNFGRQFRFGLVDLDAFTDVWALGIVMCWYKFKPIIEGYRRW